MLANEEGYGRQARNMHLYRLGVVDFLCAGHDVDALIDAFQALIGKPASQVAKSFTQIPGLLPSILLDDLAGSAHRLLESGGGVFGARRDFQRVLVNLGRDAAFAHLFQ
jgi:hypothetical protein